MEFIKLNSEFEYRVDSNNIIKSVLKNELGNPILRSDLIPKIKDETIKNSLLNIKEKNEVRHLPKLGETITKDVLYISEYGLIKCIETVILVKPPVDLKEVFSDLTDFTKDEPIKEIVEPIIKTKL